MIRTLVGNVRHSQRYLSVDEEKVPSEILTTSTERRQNILEDLDSLFPSQSPVNHSSSKKISSKSSPRLLQKQQSIPALLSPRSRRHLDKNSRNSKSTRVMTDTKPLLENSTSKGSFDMGSKSDISADTNGIEEELRALLKSQRKEKSRRKLQVETRGNNTTEKDISDKKSLETFESPTPVKNKKSSRSKNTRKSKSMRNLNARPKIDTPAAYKKRSYSIRNLNVAETNNDFANFPSTMAKMKRDALPLCPLVVKEVEEEEEESEANDLTAPLPEKTPHCIKEDTTPTVNTDSKPKTLRETLLRIDAKLNNLLDSMKETRRKITDIQCRDESPLSSDTESITEIDDDW